MKPEAVLVEESNTTDRFRDYFDTHFPSANYPQETWIENANESKLPLARMLGLPHANGGLVFKLIQAPGEHQLDYNVKSNLEAMIRRAEGLVGSSEAFSWAAMDVDLDSLTYKNKKGKRQKLLRRLRKLPLSEQEKAFNNLKTILGYLYQHFDPLPDGNMPFEKMWPKLGDKLKAQPVVLLTPDPLMILGSGLFKNTGSCHRPGGEYELGPFTYAQDEHTLAAFVFDSLDYKALTPEALFTPYTESQWRSQDSPCGRALGRALYYVHDPNSYRSHDEAQGELILNANFTADTSSVVEGGKLAYFVQSRSYGIMNDAIHKEVRHVLEEKLRTHKGIPSTPWKLLTAGSISLVAPSFTYTDGSHFVGKYIQVDSNNNSVALDLESVPEIGLETPECPCCGGDIEDCGCLSSRTCCCNCGEPVHENDDYRDDDGNAYCEECFFESYSYCDYCGEVTNREDIVCIQTPRGEDYWCEDCAYRRATQCDECGEYIHDSFGSMTELVGDTNRVVCDSCYESIGGRCDRCNDPFHYRDLKEHDGDCYCEYCLEEVEKEEEESELELESESDSEENALPLTGEATVDLEVRSDLSVPQEAAAL